MSGTEGEIHLQSDSYATGKTIVDMSNDSSAHLDAFQIIPDNTWIRYGYSVAENIVITGNKVISPYSMRNGIGSFDGLVRNLVAANNFFYTASTHEITINGLISGFLLSNHRKNTVTDTTEPAKIQLNPWRIGGGYNPLINTPFLWVVNVKGGLYEPILIDDTYNFIDVRTEPLANSVGSVYVVDFDLPMFSERHPQVNQYNSLQTYIEDVRSLALECSTTIG